MATDTTKICSLCHATDYRRCHCPWDKPFADWPHILLYDLKQQIGPGPHKGS